MPASWLRFSSAKNGTLLLREGVVKTEAPKSEYRFRGDIALVPDKNGRISIVNLVDQDEVVAGVLPSEMFASAPLEALKAQAITARGELFAKIGRRHFSEPSLVCAEQHCQVYRGVAAEDERTNQAAFHTQGELAFQEGKLVDSVYSACCGGHTEDASVVWDRPPSSALQGVPDVPLLIDGGAARSLEASLLFAAQKPGVIPQNLSSDQAVEKLLLAPRSSAFCGSSTFNQKGDAWRWERVFTSAELTAAFADLGVGDVVRMVVEDRGRGGRVRTLRVDGKTGSARVLRELPVRKRLGNLRSGLFVVDEERDASGALVSVRLRGAGFGHGSGMCQQGAIGMAEAGYDYRAIVRHYFQGAEIKKVF